MSWLTLTGFAEWISMIDGDHTEQIIELHRMGDISLCEGITFPEAEVAILRQCNKNFVYYWLRHEIFPKLTHVYLDSHPCEPEVFRQFDTINFYLHENYGSYKHRYASDLDYVQVLSKTQFEEAIEDLKYQPCGVGYQETLRHWVTTISDQVT